MNTLRSPSMCSVHSVGSGLSGDFALDDFDSGSAILEFRRSYRRFREGHCVGAKGEICDVVRREIVDDNVDASWESVLGIDGFADDGDEELGYRAVRDFRLRYRRHRMKLPGGAKGEVLDLAKKLSSADCRLLPASQLLHFRKQLVAWNEALVKKDFQDVSSRHLHVGAGKIGLGLALPAFVQSGRPFAILQRPSDAWSHAARAGRAAIRVNRELLVELRVVSTLRELDEAIVANARAVLVLSSEPAVVCALASRVSSFSCAVGGKDLTASLKPLLDAISTIHSKAKAEAELSGSEKVRPPVMPLYACENDHEAVESLAKVLAGRADVVPVLVDRVCTDRILNVDGSVDVGTEPYQGDLVLPPAADLSIPRPPLPFGGAAVHQPATEEGAAFLHRKKILTVNGTHTTIAFLTLVDKEPLHEGPPMASHELLSFDINALSENIGRKVWAWAVARQVMLLYEFDESVIRHTMLGSTEGDSEPLAEALLKYASGAVARLSRGGDQTSRVLGGGVENRWRTRLANVEDFLNSTPRLDRLSKTMLRAAGISEVELRSCVSTLVADSKRFIKPARNRSPSPKRQMRVPGSASKSPGRPLQSSLHDSAQVAVLFDFDGTVGDTETPAMEIAFWEIAPYLPHLSKASRTDLEAACPIYIRENAGKAFEHMLEACDLARHAAGLASVEETRADRGEPTSLLVHVDTVREALGLRSIRAMRVAAAGSAEAEPETLLQQQKQDTVVRLAKVTRPNPGVVFALDQLRQTGTNFVIATTSGKPRVPVCVDAAGLRSYFPSDDAHIHSGESDFDPPRFKPAPDVYLRAAKSVGRMPCQCVAVEDSASGVGSAANAGIGLIVGYVGASHIADDVKKQHASMLMAGTRAENGRGADIVISHMGDLPKLVEMFATRVAAGRGGDGGSALPVSRCDVPVPVGLIYTKGE